jgi:hypothetical protein
MPRGPDGGCAVIGDLCSVAVEGQELAQAVGAVVAVIDDEHGQGAR